MRRSFKLPLLVFILLLATAPVARAVCYVTTAGTGANSGASWSSPFDLQTALTTSTCTEIWVAKGIYTPGASQSASFIILPGAAVYGGFAGTEISRGQRNANPVSNGTVLSGDYLKHDCGGSGCPGGIVPDYTQLDVGSNNVVTIDGTASAVIGSTVLDGFTITGGLSNGQGAGMICNGEGSECSPTLSNLVFSGNEAANGGGAMYDNGENGVSSPTLTNVTFSGNSAAQAGGALYNDGSGTDSTSSPTLTHVIFNGNSAPGYNRGGGALYNDGSSGGNSVPQLTDVTFDHNSTNNYGGAMYDDGENGGLSNPLLTQVTFHGNSAALGGAVFNDGFEGSSSPDMNNVIFDANTASSCGALSNSGAYGLSSPTLIDATFSDNSATGSGGGAMCNNGTAGHSDPTLINITFSGNHAPIGGAIWNSAPNPGSGGDSSPTLINVTFENNRATNNGGAMYNQSETGSKSNPTLSNVILWNDSAPSGPEIFNDFATATPTINHSIVKGSHGSGSNWDTTLGTDGGGNLDADPKLRALADNGGFTHTMLLFAGSPALDAGNDATCPATDQRGVTRPQGPHCDIGAVEDTAIEAAIMEVIPVPAPTLDRRALLLLGALLALSSAGFSLHTSRSSRKSSAEIHP